MGYVLKENEIYEDKYGKAHSNAYVAIEVKVLEKRKKQVTMVMKIYASKASANAGKEPLEIIQEVIENNPPNIRNFESVPSTNYDDYIVESTGQIKQLYNYWNDKKISKGGFNFNKFKSDEE